ncbi:MAG: restriction endonuclease [Acidobacteriota bacterium]
MYYGRLLGPGSCPVDFAALKASLPLYNEDVDKGNEFVMSLLKEAVSFKQWTIPHGAYVQMDIGPFKAVKLFELADDICCVLADDSGHYFMVWVDPVKQIFSFVHNDSAYLDAADRVLLEMLKDGNVTRELLSDVRPGKTTSTVSSPEELRRRIHEKVVFEDERFTLGLKILLSAIIRDFWVVEQRERVFGKGMLARKSSRLRADWGKKTIVYLPRVRYVGTVTRGEEQLHVITRAAHFVTGHLRRAVKANELQIMLARRFGVVVPEGFTFVKPHRRGDKAEERVYSSRSALQCLHALAPIDQIESDSWFSYELNVKNWLKTHGYEVEHLAGSRNGDGGVDIQASKEDEHLLVQCKFWLSQKIGPNIVREMLGTLKTFPAGSRGVIITSSELTEGARNLALEHGIQFIERANFSKAIDTAIIR